jgi:Uma2 family endonuclease
VYTNGMVNAYAHKLTPAEYLTWEETQVERHEYVAGEVFAMVGVKRTHGEVVTNLVVALGVFLKGKSCRVYSESLKVQVTLNYFYPDVFVTCSKKDLNTDRIFTEPKLIIEVQSDSTAVYDRGVKFAHYRQLASLEEYAIVDPETRRIEVFRKQADDIFGLHDYSTAATARFESIAFEITLTDLFAGVSV